MTRLLLFSVLAILPTACLGSDLADSVEGSWQMTSGTVDGEGIPILDSHPVTITFEEGQVSGTAACNGYSGAFEMNGSSISLSDPAMTEMACFPEETMRAETLFGEAITRVDTVTVDGNLTLSGDRVDLTFEALEPVPDAELAGERWVLNGLIEGDAVSTPMAGSEAFIEFSVDGSVVGDTGCRPFSGEYVIDGDEVLVTELAADGHECEPDFAGQDDLFLSVVGDGFRVEIEGNSLTLSSREDEGLTFITDE